MQIILNKLMSTLFFSSSKTCYNKFLAEECFLRCTMFIMRLCIGIKYCGRKTIMSKACRQDGV